ECVERFGRLDGVIHAPAEGGSQAALLPVTEIDDESFAGRIHQRVRGAAVLAEALGDREPDFCLLISSLSSVLGGVGLVADVAADCCLELLARSASRDAATVWRSILWDNEGAGAIRPEDGVAALERLLCSQFFPCIAVSTVDLEARIDLRYAEPETTDEAVASRRPRPQLESPYAAPEDELEEAICAIWEELFGIGGIGIDDDFFALGGHSLLATQLVSRVRDQFEVELLLREALEMPTIRQLAVVVAEKQIAAGGGDLEQFLDQLEGMSDEEAREISG
ncbi:MAG: KR domain-containing protein, partial [bacterium]|nr:KR domain-containing protein [bacterium]